MSFFRKAKTEVITSRVQRCGKVLWSGSLFIGFLVFVSFILPSLENKGYVYSMCNVTKFLVLSDSYNRLSCKCPVSLENHVSKCVIYYPCLRIFASFVDSIGILREGLVVKCRRHVGEKCSQRVPEYDCSTENAVYKKLEKMKDKYSQPGTSFPCYYKESKPGYVVLKSEHLVKKHLVNAILWPCLGAVTGLGLMFYNRVLSVLSTCFYGYKKENTSDNEHLLPLTSNTDL